MNVKNRLEIKKWGNSYALNYPDELDLSEITDLSGYGFYATFFSPIYVFEKTRPWNRITLTKDEIHELVVNVSPELKNSFLVDGSFNEDTSNIMYVTFDYREIAIVRPWFKPEFFQSRNWKLEDGTMVSDVRSLGSVRYLHIFPTLLQ
ncbi:MAG: hypothetical protein L0H53_16990 [Candidatus Nitrosocosmicus sp.]|nr:hypothetical protein [Candidatus Nitrosocosmicus sp.]MDN5868198.1 hypothetical protein [Candidatus Nitrosocosmicus sp.]